MFGKIKDKSVSSLHLQSILWLIIVISSSQTDYLTDNQNCSFEILSVDPNSSDRYFAFNISQVEDILGTTYTSNSKWTVFYSGTNEIRDIIIWKGTAGASKGDGHGRINPWDDSALGDWDVNERIAFCVDDECTSAICYSDINGIFAILHDDKLNAYNSYFFVCFDLIYRRFV